MRTDFCFSNCFSGGSLPDDSSSTIPSSLTSVSFPSFRLPSSNMISTWTANIFFDTGEGISVVHPVRRKKLPGKNHRPGKSPLLPFSLQGPVYLNTFFNCNALIAIQKNFHIIGGFYPDIHQKIEPVPAANISCQHCFNRL